MRCAYCEAEFTPKRTTGKYCSAKCRAAAWQANREHELSSVTKGVEQILHRLQELQRQRDNRWAPSETLRGGRHEDRSPQLKGVESGEHRTEGDPGESVHS